MNKTVELFFDFGSPASYLAWTQLPSICERAKARLQYQPMLLGGVFQATGNASPISVPAKGRHMLRTFSVMRCATTCRSPSIRISPLTRLR